MPSIPGIKVDDHRENDWIGEAWGVNPVLRMTLRMFLTVVFHDGCIV
jgi:hypothetical protein